jgi:ectoine hydroxylase-related dioxygenase (phytanoyl-CoA dioxygenase family)
MLPAGKSYAVKERTEVQSDVDRHVEEIRLLGYTIVHGLVPQNELEVLRERLDSVYKQQVEEIGGEEQLALMNDRYAARCLLAYDEIFLRLASSPKIMSILRPLLGHYFIIMQQTGLLNLPAVGNQQNAGLWHRDLNYQHYVSSRPLSISVLVCVDPFLESSGSTILLPATHKSEAFPSEDFICAHGTVFEAPAGSCLVFDSMLFHRGGLNRSDKPRRAINHMYSIPVFKQQISLPMVLGGKYSDDPFLRKLLGYECESASSVKEFRVQRIGRATY